MAARQTPAVGSVGWIAEERGVVKRVLHDDLEAMAYGVREDYDWLMEHMADVFNSNVFDVAEIMKTPARLREKTPRTGRKTGTATKSLKVMREVAPSSPIKQSTPAPPSAPEFFPPAVPQLQSLHDAPRSPVKSSPAKHKTTESPHKTPFKEILQPHDQTFVSTASLGDSGFYTASNANSQVEALHHKPSRSRDSTGSRESSVPTKQRRSPRLSEPKEDSASRRNSFSTAREDVSQIPLSSPSREVVIGQVADEEEQDMEVETQVETHLAEELPEDNRHQETQHDEALQNEIQNEEQIQIEDELEDEIVEQVVEYPEPEVVPNSTKRMAENNRRSGRLAVRPSPSATKISRSSPAPEVAMSPTPPSRVIAPISVAAAEPEATIYPSLADPTPEPEMKQLEALMETKSKTAYSPETETRTVPLSQSGISSKSITESLINVIRQGGSAKADWASKKPNGKSLGGSSQTIIRQLETDVDMEKFDDEQSPVLPEPRIGDKRKNEGQSPRVRKVSRGPDVIPTQEASQEPTGEEHGYGRPFIQETQSLQSLYDNTARMSRGGHDYSEADKAITQSLRDNIARMSRTRLMHVAYPDLHAGLKMSVDNGMDSGPMDHDSKPGREVIDPTVTKNPSKIGTCRSASPLIGSPAVNPVVVKSPEGPRQTRSKTVGAVADDADPITKQSTPQHSTPRRPSPIKIVPAPVSSIKETFESRQEVAASPLPVQRSAKSPPLSPVKTIFNSINDVPQFAALNSVPKRSPVPEPVSSGYKSAISSPFHKAREMLKTTTSNKSEAVNSPSLNSPPLRKWQGTESLQDVFKRDATRSSAEAKAPERDLYPDLGSVLSPSTKGKERETTPASAPVAAVRTPQGRQTRNSRSRTDEVMADAPPSASVEPARHRAESRAEEERLRRLEYISKRSQMDYMRLNQLENEERLAKQQQEEQQVHDHDFSDDDMNEEYAKEQSARSRSGSVDPSGRSVSRLEQQRQQGQLRYQSSKGDPKRTVSVKTSSQRELEYHRSKTTMTSSGPSGSALVSVLKSSFESLPTMDPKQPSTQAQPPSSSRPESNPRLHTSSSNGSLRSTGSSINASTGIKTLKSLQSAANQRKKEQEAKDRKETLKRERERREIEKKEQQRRQEEEQKRQKATTPVTRPLIRPGTTQSTYRQVSQEPEPSIKKPYRSLNKAPVASIKRTLPQDTEEARIPVRPGTSASNSSLNDGSKKRRTNDYEETYESVFKSSAHPSMQKKVVPPIRGGAISKELSAVSKEHMSKSLYYGQSSSQTTSSSQVKASSSRVPQVESVKYSKDKIKFAEAAPSQANSISSSSASQSVFKTPAAPKVAGKGKTPAAFKESPMYPAGESIVLPDIPTDSEEEDDYPSKKSEFPLPSWAESPELRELLRRQQTIDPTDVFGPMAKLDMEAIFRTEGKGRFRARTSSANWNGGDRLTQDEIRADQEARRKMNETGRWRPDL
ncbi:hypothetical protein FPQ18DRAFT_313914 [Pyronema domesticum]|nr:hypothetical protein FPQ18DRAFT_313914 [Pyronema domesticum]